MGYGAAPPDPSSGVWTARADGEEGCYEETEGNHEEGGREEEMSRCGEEEDCLNKEKKLTRVCGATDSSPQQPLAWRQVLVTGWRPIRPPSAKFSVIGEVCPSADNIVRCRSVGEDPSP